MFLFQIASDDCNYYKCLEYLLSYKCNTNVDCSNLTPLKPFPIFHAIKLDQTKELSLMIKYNCNVDVINSKGVTSLCKICRKGGSKKKG